MCGERLGPNRQAVDARLMHAEREQRPRCTLAAFTHTGVVEGPREAGSPSDKREREREEYQENIEKTVSCPSLA